MTSEFTLKEWSNTPRTLAESLAWAAVETSEAVGEAFEWKGATKEPFLTLEAAGGVKLQTVTRLSSGLKVTIHFWQSTKGLRSHLKVKTT